MPVDIKHKQTKSHGGNTWKKTWGQHHHQIYGKTISSLTFNGPMANNQGVAPPPTLARPSTAMSAMGWAVGTAAIGSNGYVVIMKCINQHAGTSNIKREFLSTDSMMKSAWESSSMYWNLRMRDTKMQTSAVSSLSRFFCLYLSG